MEMINDGENDYYVIPSEKNDARGLALCFYDKLIGFSNGKRCQIPTKKNIGSCAYLWNETDDDMEVKGEADYILHGMHTYGGYYGFFRPDLVEVFWLISQNIPVEKLEQAKKIYLTTQPRTGNANDYNSKVDRHYGITRVYLN